MDTLLRWSIRKLAMQAALEKEPQTILTCQPIVYSVYGTFQRKTLLENLKFLLIEFFICLCLQSQEVV